MKVDCSNSELTSLPNSLSDFSNLELDCSNNKLTKISLENVSKLICGGNDLREIYAPNAMYIDCSGGGAYKNYYLNKITCSKGATIKLPKCLLAFFEINEV